MPESLESAPSAIGELSETLRRIEQRLEALETWREQMEGHSSEARLAQETEASGMAGEEAPAEFDFALTGRTLIILGGAFLLRAATEAGAIPVAAGVGIGLLYAVLWSVLSLRKKVSRSSAVYYAMATVFTALPLILEATRTFNVLTGWSAALALALVAAVVFVLAWRRRLHGTAWIFTVMTIGILPLLMFQTKAVVPFALLLLALGVVTLWFGYLLDWQLLSWLVAVSLDLVLLVFSVLVATNRLPEVSTPVAILVLCLAFAAYLASFAVRALGGRRDAAGIDIAQTFTLLLVALGGAMWIAVSRSAYLMPMALAMLGLAAISYAVSFTFVARRFLAPRNFVLTSSLGLMLVVLGGAFLAHGRANSILWSALALSSAYLATHYQKSSLALHTAVFLFCGFIGADVLGLGFQSMLTKGGQPWPVPGEGAAFLFVACLLASGIRPIERQGTFELWTAAKVMIFAELGWIGAALAASAGEILFLSEGPADPGRVAVLRTAIVAGLTVTAAWASRFATFSPARLLCNPLMIVMGVKLLWEDVRAGRPAMLFISFAVVGAAWILTPRLRRKATRPEAVMAPAVT